MLVIILAVLLTFYNEVLLYNETYSILLLSQKSDKEITNSAFSIAADIQS